VTFTQAVEEALALQGVRLDEATFRQRLAANTLAVAALVGGVTGFLHTPPGKDLVAVVSGKPTSFDRQREINKLQRELEEIDRRLVALSAETRAQALSIMQLEYVRGVTEALGQYIDADESKGDELKYLTTKDLGVWDSLIVHGDKLLAAQRKANYPEMMVTSVEKTQGRLKKMKRMAEEINLSTQKSKGGKRLKRKKQLMRGERLSRGTGLPGLTDMTFTEAYEQIRLEEGLRDWIKKLDRKKLTRLAAITGVALASLMNPSQLDKSDYTALKKFTVSYSGLALNKPIKTKTVDGPLGQAEVQLEPVHINSLNKILPDGKLHDIGIASVKGEARTVFADFTIEVKARNAEEAVKIFKWKLKKAIDEMAGQTDVPVVIGQETGTLTVKLHEAEQTFLVSIKLLFRKKQ